MTRTKPSTAPPQILPIRQLGHGAVAEVLLVEVNGRRAAWKRPLAQYRAHAGVARLLREEADTARKLRHPSIPQLIDVVDDPDAPGSVSLLFEVIDGVTLHELTDGNDSDTKHDPWPAPQVAHVCSAVLSALAHAHERGIVHRDVNPRNVMIARSGDAVLIDFGIALIEDRARWTAAGAKRGTLGYLAPELLREESVDARADLFAVGALVFRLLYGKPAFSGKGPLLLMNAIAEARVDVPAAAPAALRAFFARTLTKEPQARYASAADAKRALDAALPSSPDARVKLAQRLPPAPVDDGGHPRTRTR